MEIQNRNFFDDIPTHVTNLIFCNVNVNVWHYVLRVVCKDFNVICNLYQTKLKLKSITPMKRIQYWLLKLMNLKYVKVCYNDSVNDELLMWMGKRYLSSKLSESNDNPAVNVSVFLAIF